MKKLHRPLALSAMMAGLMLAGCFQKTPQETLESARKHVAQREFSAATIELKNVLLEVPASAEARYLLGVTLYETGNFPGAVAELRRALEYKHPDTVVLPVLARAMLGLRAHKKIIDEFSPVVLSDPEAAADLSISIANAHAVSGQTGKATAILQGVLQKYPEFASALLLQARIAAAEGKPDAALTLVNDVLKRDAKNQEALFLMGELHSILRDPEAAAKAFAAVLAIDPTNVAARSARIAILVQKRDFAAARTELDQLKAVRPNHPLTRFLSAELQFLNEDYRGARQQVQELLKVAPDHARLLQLAGAVELKLNSYQQAETYLNKTIKIAPDLAAPRLLLAEVHLRAGNADKVLVALEPILGMAAPPSQALALAAEANLILGDASAAESLYQQSDKLRPNDVRTRTALALSKMIRGASAEGFAELQSIAAGDTSGTTADLALISARLKRREWDLALQAINALDKKTSTKALAPMLRGRLATQKGDQAEAKRAFEDAARREPMFFPAIASLALLDAEQQDLGKAVGRVQQFLKEQPQHVRATMLLANFKVRQKAPAAEVASLINAAVGFDINDPAPRGMLIEHHLGSGDPKAALNAAQAAVAVIPTDVDLLGLLGRAQMESREFNQAITTFSKINTLQPRAMAAYLGLADAHIAATSNVAAAVQALDRALLINPTSLDIQRKLIALNARQNRMPQAIQGARTVQRQRPKQAVGYVLEGQLRASKGDHAAAAEAYRKGLDKAEPSPAAVGFHFSLISLKRNAEADQFASTWRKSRPNDTAFHFYMGDWAMARGDYPGAEASYAEVVRQQPSNAMALNNQAWLWAKLGRVGATALAERALKLAPDNAAILDTLAYALASGKDFSKAVAASEKAVAAAPNMLVYKLNLAKYQVQAGNKQGARATLESLRQVGDKFAGAPEVEALLQQTK